MLEFFKESQVVVYLDPREGMIAPLNFDSNWTEIRIGAFISGRDYISDINSVDDQVGFGTETPGDSLYFGLKNSDNNALPGEVNSLYLGIRTQSAGVSENQSEWVAYNPPIEMTEIGDAVGQVQAVGFQGATMVDGGNIRSSAYANGTIKFADYSAGDGYCGLYVIKFVINNKGFASQSVSMSLAQKAVVDGFDYSPFALRQEMNNADFGPSVTIPWNSGGAAREIPDSFFVRMPFFKNIIMIASMRAIKYQPE
jgi:hypothetical protein